MTHRLDRVFLDSSFVIATYNLRDQFHRRALQVDAALLTAREIWTTDGVLLEIAASLAKPSTRAKAVQTWDQFHGLDGRFHCVELSGTLLADAMDLYRERPDKAWSLTDCLSFIVMERERLIDALTSDEHFEQAGFRALLL